MDALDGRKAIPRLHAVAGSAMVVLALLSGVLILMAPEESSRNEFFVIVLVTFGILTIIQATRLIWAWPDKRTQTLTRTKWRFILFIAIGVAGTVYYVLNPATLMLALYFLFLANLISLVLFETGDPSR